MTNEYYYWYKSRHICTSCFARTAARGKTKCLDCLDEDAERARQKRAAWTDEQCKRAKKVSNECHKKLYEERKSRGLCVQCGNRPPQGASVRCGICKAKARAAQDKIRRKRGQRTYMECLELGNCYNCGGAPLPNKRLCAECYDKAVANLQKANEKIQWYKHPWRNGQ